MSPLLRAVLLALAAAFLFNIETVLGKALAHLPIELVVLTRATGQLAWNLPALLRQGLTVLRTRQPGMQIFRGSLSVGTWGFYFFAFSHLPLATATVLNFTSVLFVTALAGPVLKEQVGWRRWMAAAVGFAGVVVIVRPGALPLGWPVAAAILSAFASATIVLTTRHLAKTERTQTIMAWIGLVSFAAALPFGAPHLHWPGWQDAALMLGLATIGPCAMHLWISGLRLADASVLAPIGYVRLLFAAASGMLLFGEVPDTWLGLGALLIIGSAVYITHREAVAARRALTGCTRPARQAPGAQWRRGAACRPPNDARCSPRRPTHAAGRADLRLQRVRRPLPLPHRAFQCDVTAGDKVQGESAPCHTVASAASRGAGSKPKSA